MPHTITVEPLTHALRQRTNLGTDPHHLAVVARTGIGTLAKVCGTFAAADISHAYASARHWAATTGATVVTAHSMAPTVVGPNVAAMVASRPDCQPIDGERSALRRIRIADVHVHDLAGADFPGAALVYGPELGDTLDKGYVVIPEAIARRDGHLVLAVAGDLHRYGPAPLGDADACRAAAELHARFHGRHREGNRYVEHANPLAVGEARPVLTPGDITVTSDGGGRDVVVIPDEVARLLRAEVKAGWSECRGLAYGESRRFFPGSWVYDVTTAIMACYADSPVPVGIDARDAEHARRDRGHAAMGYSVRADIVGVSGWDPAARWWREYDNTRHLHVSGTPQIAPENGQPAYRYAG